MCKKQIWNEFFFFSGIIGPLEAQLCRGKNVFIQSSNHEQDVTQGQFLREARIQNFFLLNWLPYQS